MPSRCRQGTKPLWCREKHFTCMCTQEKRSRPAHFDLRIQTQLENLQQQEESEYSRSGPLITAECKIQQPKIWQKLYSWHNILEWIPLHLHWMTKLVPGANYATFYWYANDKLPTFHRLLFTWYQTSVQANLLTHSITCLFFFVSFWPCLPCYQCTMLWLNEIRISIKKCNNFLCSLLLTTFAFCRKNSSVMMTLGPLWEAESCLRVLYANCSFWVNIIQTSDFIHYGPARLPHLPLLRWCVLTGAAFNQSSRRCGLSRSASEHWHISSPWISFFMHSFRFLYQLEAKLEIS